MRPPVCNRDARRNKHLTPTSIAAAYLSWNVVEGVAGRGGPLCRSENQRVSA